MDLAMTTQMQASWSKISFQKKWKQTASTGGGGGTASPRPRKVRARGQTQSEVQCASHPMVKAYWLQPVLWPSFIYLDLVNFMI